MCFHITILKRIGLVIVNTRASAPLVQSVNLGLWTKSTWPRTTGDKDFRQSVVIVKNITKNHYKLAYNCKFRNTNDMIIRYCYVRLRFHCRNTDFHNTPESLNKAGFHMTDMIATMAVNVNVQRPLPPVQVETIVCQFVFYSIGIVAILRQTVSRKDSLNLSCNDRSDCIATVRGRNDQMETSQSERVERKNTTKTIRPREIIRKFLISFFAGLIVSICGTEEKGQSTRLT